jgi:hypothetical protein
MAHITVQKHELVAENSLKITSLGVFGVVTFFHVVLQGLLAIVTPLSLVIILCVVFFFLSAG